LAGEHLPIEVSLDVGAPVAEAHRIGTNLGRHGPHTRSQCFRITCIAGKPGTRHPDDLRH
jgi:hypothetical protein